MEEVNALKIRNNLGEILDRLDRKGDPIFISKGRKVRAVLVTFEQFEKRFLVACQGREEAVSGRCQVLEKKPEGSHG